jgi:hypothetical protein
MHFSTSNAFGSLEVPFTSRARAKHLSAFWVVCVRIQEGRIHVASARSESNNSDSQSLSPPATLCVVLFAWT